MKSSTRSLVIALSILLCNYANSQSISFYPNSEFPIGSNPVQIISKDINGDGKPDMLSILNTGNLLSIYMNITPAGATTAVYAPRQDITLVYAPLALLAEDFDADGKPDIIISYAGGPSFISGYPNVTTPGSLVATFGGRVDFFSYPGTRSFATGDFNNDGRPDLATVNPAYNYVTILYNSPTSGTSGWYLNYGGWTVITSANPALVAVADINNDGKDDIVASCGAGIVSTLINATVQGSYSASFYTHQDVVVAGAGFANFLMGDLNNDGKKDLVFSNNPAGTCTVILNNTTYAATTITYKDAQQFSCGANPIGLTLADINGDGKLDLIASITGSPYNIVSILRNTTTHGTFPASFAVKQDFTVHNYPVSLVTSDYNGDGKADLGVLTNSGFIDVFLNATAIGASAASFAPHADFAVLSPVMAVKGDLNNDGKPDIIVVNGATNMVSIFMNATPPGNTIAVFGTRQDIGGFNNPVIATVADFTMDGREDIMIVNKNNGYLTMLNNTTSPGSAVFSFNFQNFAAIPYALAVAVGDINQDCKPDMVLTASDGGLYTFINATTPGSGGVAFSYGAISAGGIGYSVSLADMNGDGKSDVLVASYTSNAINIFVNNTAQGYGSFNYYSIQTFPTLNNPQSMVTADINADGRPDVTTCNDNTISVQLNAGTLGSATVAFAARKEFNESAGMAVNTMLSGDINGDGLTDIAVANRLSNSISVFQNTTILGSVLPNFAGQQDFSTGPAPASLFSGDFNADNQVDLFTVNTGNSTLSVLLNTAAASLPVRMLNFSGERKNNSILLSWATSDEVNNRGYAIEKSIDGRTWLDIGFVPAAEEGALLNKYSFTDDNPANGKNYYRLRQEDLDRNAAYSKVIAISFDNSSSFQCYAGYPNPFVSNTAIRYRVPVTSQVSIKIYNFLGEEVDMIQNGQKSPGEYLVSWNASKFANGVYYIRMVAGNFAATQKVIKGN